MLPSFVIGLREGLEAALIVGIVAAFLRKQGRRDLLRSVLIGVGIAVLLCLAGGVALDLFSRALPTRQQEGLETVIGAIAVGMVTYMVVWMRRNSRGLKGQLEGMAADAMTGSRAAGRAMVLMAFLAVIREGVETVVFLLAAFNETGSTGTAGLGAVLGILVAVGLGYGIYRGGVSLNLSKFFRATGLVLVLVAAGLVVNALRTAHEAGWLTAGQGATIDLSGVVTPGSVQSSLLTGMLGIQSRPVTIEVIGWLVYLVPVGLYVAWPPGRPAPTRALVRGGLGVAALAGVGALLLGLLAPAAVAGVPVTSGRGPDGALRAQVVTRSGPTLVVRTTDEQPLARTAVGEVQVKLSPTAATTRAGLPVTKYVAHLGSGSVAGRPATLPVGDIARLGGGRLPIGVTVGTSPRLPVSYTGVRDLTVWIDPATSRIVDLRWDEQVLVSVRSAGGATVPLSLPVAEARAALPTAAVRAAAAAVRGDHAATSRRSTMLTACAWLLAVAVIGLAVALAGLLLSRRQRRDAAATPVTDRSPVAVG